MADPKLITLPLSGPFTDGDMTVDVQIYGLEDLSRVSAASSEVLFLPTLL